MTHKIMMVTPLYRAVPAQAVPARDRLIVELVQSQLLYTLSYRVGHFVDHSRNQLVDEALECVEKPTHLLFVDDDVAAPPGAVNALLSHKLPVIAAAYKIILQDEEYVAAWTNKEGGNQEFVNWDEVDGHLEMVHGVGMGFTLIEISVLRAMREKFGTYFNACTKRVGNDISFTGEDVDFCDKLEKLGVPAFVDLSIRCKHYGVSER